jgi:hypothetical protein
MRSLSVFPGFRIRFKAGVDAVRQLQAGTQAELDALLPSILDKAFRGELV